MVVQERALIWKEDWGGYCIPHFTPTLHSSSLILFHLYPFFSFSKEKTNRFTCKQLLQAKRPLGLMFWTSDGYLRSCSRLDKVLIFFSVFLLTPLPLSLSLSIVPPREPQVTCRSNTYPKGFYCSWHLLHPTYIPTEFEVDVQ